MSQFANLHKESHDSKQRQAYVTDLFNQLAPRYDRFNQWVSFRQDEAWRQQAMKLLGDCGKGTVLDLAAGTGDLAKSAIETGAEQVHVFDISHEMLRVAKAKLSAHNNGAQQIAFQQGSAHQLPFADATIDGVVSGFAMRNVFHFLDEVLTEIRRVLRPGGRFAILELSRPQNPLLRAGFKLHMQTIMPFIGRLTTGRSSPFAYLCQTTMTFLDPKEFKQRLEKAGFENVCWQSFLLGGIAIHHGTKPSA